MGEFGKRGDCGGAGDVPRVSRLQAGRGGGLAGEAGAVAAFGFGCVEGAVGGGEELLDAVAIERIGGDADAQAEGDGLAGGRLRAGGGGRDFAETARGGEGIGGSAFDLDDGELVAAVAGDGVGGARLGEEELGDVPEDAVAGGVAVGVVDRFKLIEVDQQKGERAEEACGALALGGEESVELAAVEQACDLVAGGQAAEAGEGVAELEGVAQGAFEEARGDFVLVEIIAGAGACGGDIDILGAPAGEDDDRGVALGGGGVAQELEAVAGAELIIEQAGAEIAGGEFGEGRLVVAVPFELKSLPLETPEHFLDDLELHRVVVDEEQASWRFEHVGWGRQ